MRVTQQPGTRGSLRWIQQAINQRRDVFDPLVLEQIPGATTIQWLSPLAADDFAEYRDGDFLEKIGHLRHAPELSAYWPARGPQWDALGITNSGEAILVEAKAHIAEFLSAGTQAGPESRPLIERTLAETVSALHAKPLIRWTGALYQTANRMAHLKFLIDRKIAAKLIFICFVGDGDMHGPQSADEWRGAIHLMRLMLGLPKQHALTSHIRYVFVQVQTLT